MEINKKEIKMAINEIKLLYPAKQETYVATKSDLDACEELRLIKQEEDRLDKRKKMLILQLMTSMKSADKLKHGDKILVTWRDKNRSFVDTAYLKSNHHDVWEKCLKNQNVRYFVQNFNYKRK